MEENPNGEERYQVAIAMIRRTNEKPNGDGNGPKIEGEEVETVRNKATSKKIQAKESNLAKLTAIEAIWQTIGQ
jgi:hypothetical protein